MRRHRIVIHRDVRFGLSVHLNHISPIAPMICTLNSRNPHSSSTKRVPSHKDEDFVAEVTLEASQSDVAGGSHSTSSHASHDDIGRQLSSSSLVSNWVVQDFSPPVRLRMASCDKLCARAMQIEWENGTGIRRAFFFTHT